MRNTWVSFFCVSLKLPADVIDNKQINHNVEDFEFSESTI